MKPGSLRPDIQYQAVKVRPAMIADAAMLAELAARTFSDAFGAENSTEDLALHLSRSYGVAQQSTELADPAISTLIADINGQPAGYAQLKASEPPDCVPGGAPLEVMRFYVDQAWHGRGVAQQLMNAAIEEAVRRGARTLWLGVWERNPKAIAFYEKCDFVSTGTKIFCVGNDEQKDLVMVRPIQPCS